MESSILPWSLDLKAEFFTQKWIPYTYPIEWAKDFNGFIQEGNGKRKEIKRRDLLGMKWYPGVHLA